MEAVLKNLERIAELLAVTQTDGVKEWDQQTINRAFQWSRYCEHLYSRFHTNPVIRKMMEKQLQVTNDRLRAAFQGVYSDVTFARLSQCQQLLLTTLLKNPALPSSLLKLLFDTSSSWKTTGNVCQEATGQCVRVIEYTSACKVLSAIDSGQTAVGPEAEVQGTMLVERLETLNNMDSDGDKREGFLDSVLKNCGELDNLSEVIAVALLSRKNDRANNFSGVSVDKLVDWLLRNNRLFHNMCSTLPIRLLINISQPFLKFRMAYCNILKEWASQMEYDIDEGEWVQTSAKGITFKTLKNHFRSLLEEYSLLKEEMLGELNALKAADGGFDVKGLSIWGDLLYELQ
ncbi:Fanconi anemia group F protein [Osmerus mordax]|uniref:Fanconi anemia group F protein n=1 Tax=Osmerus mordax TaxID=8014 RepID=UPI003510633C